MYAYRRAFTAAGFEGYDIWGIELKTALIVSQVLGYTLSKISRNQNYLRNDAKP